MSTDVGAGQPPPPGVSRQPARPLTEADVARLRADRSDRRLRTGAAWLVPAGGLALALTVALAIPAVPCTAAAPCDPDTPGSLLVGLVGALPLLGLVHLWSAATLAVAVAVLLPWYDRTEPGDLPLWVYVLLAAYAIGCLLLATRVRTGRLGAAGQGWQAGPKRPVPPIRPRHPRPPVSVLTATVTVALLLAGLLLPGWSGYRQAGADEQQRRAEVVTATVRAHPAFDAVALDFADGRPGLTLPVYVAADYPVGSTVQVALDDAGLRQLLTEPYDATPWLALAALLGALGVAFGARVVGRVVPWYRLFRQPQPVCAVQVRRLPGQVYVYRARGGMRRPVARIEVRDIAGPPTPEGELEPATLYGVPVPGRWCTVAVGRSVLSPTGPLGAAPLPEPSARSRRWFSLFVGTPAPARDGRQPSDPTAGDGRQPSGPTAGDVRQHPDPTAGDVPQHPDPIAPRRRMPRRSPNPIGYHPPANEVRRPRDRSQSVRALRRRRRDGGSGQWPELSRFGITLVVSVVLGTIVAGIELGTECLTWLAGVICTDDGCSPVGMAAAGWALGGLPLLFLGAVCAAFGPTRRTLLTSCVGLAALTFGITLMFAGEEPAPLHEAHPELALFDPGFATTLHGLLIGAAVGRFLPRSLGARADRNAWLTRTSAAGLLPMLLVAALQIPALLVALIWAAG